MIQICENDKIPKAELHYFYKSNIFHNDILNFMQNDENSVSKIILNIKIKASGAEELNIALSLCCSFNNPTYYPYKNSCIQELDIPDSWELVNVLPLTKDTNRTELDQLRSTSLWLFQLLEKIMVITTYVFNNNISGVVLNLVTVAPLHCRVWWTVW